MLTNAKRFATSLRVRACATGLMILLSSAASAADEEAKCIPSERTGVVYEGSKIKHVTFRCARRVATGIKLTCDSGEFVMGFYCRLYGSTTGVYTALVSAGITGSRSAACLWSSQSDIAITLRCKANGALKNDAKSDEYTE